MLAVLSIEDASQLYTVFTIRISLNDDENLYQKRTNSTKVVFLLVLRANARMDVLLLFKNLYYSFPKSWILEPTKGFLD